MSGRSNGLAKGFKGIALFVAGVVAGVAGADFFVAPTPASVHQQRARGNYRFINPLLECDIAGETVQSREITPFKNDVARLVEKLIRDGEATAISVSFRDLDTGVGFGVNNEQKYTPASLAKIPVLIACLKRAEANPAFLEQRFLFDGHEDLNADQNIKPARVMTPGQRYTVDDLLRRMMGYSDNNAWAILFRQLDVAELDGIMSDMGVDFDKGKDEDMVTVQSYGKFLRILYNASYLSKRMSEKALEYMTVEDFPGGLAAGVPAGMVISDKFGERATDGGRVKQLHNFGIIYYPGRPYLLCVMTRGGDLERQTGVIRRISREVYRQVDAHMRGGGSG